MNTLKKIIKRILCNHDYEVIKEIELDIGVITSLKCMLCNKIKILIEYYD